MGVYLADMDSRDYDKMGITENYGVYIKSVVKDTPAEKAGLKKGDVLLELGNEKVYTDNQIGKMLGNYESGDTAKLLVIRDKKKKKLKITFEEKIIPGQRVKAYMGITMREIKEFDLEELGMKDDYGVIITSVVPDGPADDAGLMENDVILKIEQDKIYTIAQLKKIITLHKPDDTIKLDFFRNKKSKTIELKLGTKKIYGNDYFYEFDFLNTIPEKMFVYKYGDKNNKWIGVYVNSTTTKETIKGTDTKTVEILISDVISGKPAEKAGLKKGDILLKAAGVKIDELNDLSTEINKIEVGETIEILINRDGKDMKINVEVAERESEYRRDKVELSVDDGDVKIYIDGQEEIHYDVHEMLEGLEDLKELKELNKLEIYEDVNDLREEILEFNIDIKESGSI